MKKFLKVGSDPECFLRDRHGNLVSSIGLIPGSKSHPYKTPSGSVQPDNISAEFNSIPASSLSEFIENHRLIIKDLEDIIHQMQECLKTDNIDEFVKCIERLQNKGESYRNWCERSWKCHKFYSKEYILNTWKQFYDKIYYEKNKRRKLKENLNEK